MQTGTALLCRDDLLMGDDGGVQFWQQYTKWEEEENERLSGNQCGSKGTDENRNRQRPDGGNRGDFGFRGIDDVYNAPAPLLAANGLCILPRMLSRSATSARVLQARRLFYVTVEAEFDFVRAQRTKQAHRQGVRRGYMDSGDKATNKAMSAAYKYACLQAFFDPNGRRQRC